MQNALLDDAFVMMEHGNMSLPEALKMGLSFVKMYQKSPSFELASKQLENENRYKANVINRLDGVIAVSQARARR